MSTRVDLTNNYVHLVIFGILLFVMVTAAACTGELQDREPGVDEPNTQTNVPNHVSSLVTRSAETPTVVNILPTYTMTFPTQDSAAPDKEFQPTTESESLTTTETQVCSPLEGHTIDELPEIVSAAYDPPPPGKEERHHGVDFSYYRRGERKSILGVGVQSVFVGRVVAAVTESFPYGNFVLVETPAANLPSDLPGELGLEDDQSLYLLYAHLQNPPLVSSGDSLISCQLLGEVGKSGNAGIAHLHLEARIGPQGAVMKGMAYYHTQTSAEERSNYELWRTSGTFQHLDPMRIFR